MKNDDDSKDEEILFVGVIFPIDSEALQKNIGICSRNFQKQCRYAIANHKFDNLVTEHCMSCFTQINDAVKCSTTEAIKTTCRNLVNDVMSFISRIGCSEKVLEDERWLKVMALGVTLSLKLLENKQDIRARNRHLYGKELSDYFSKYNHKYLEELHTKLLYACRNDKIAILAILIRVPPLHCAIQSQMLAKSIRACLNDVQDTFSLTSKKYLILMLAYKKLYDLLPYDSKHKAPCKNTYNEEFSDERIPKLILQFLKEKYPSIKESLSQSLFHVPTSIESIYNSFQKFENEKIYIPPVVYPPFEKDSKDSITKNRNESSSTSSEKNNRLLSKRLRSVDGTTPNNSLNCNKKRRKITNVNADSDDSLLVLIMRLQNLSTSYMQPQTSRTNNDRFHSNSSSTDNTTIPFNRLSDVQSNCNIQLYSDVDNSAHLVTKNQNSVPESDISQKRHNESDDDVLDVKPSIDMKQISIISENDFKLPTAKSDQRTGIVPPIIYIDLTETEPKLANTNSKSSIIDLSETNIVSSKSEKTLFSSKDQLKVNNRTSSTNLIKTPRDFGAVNSPRNQLEINKKLETNLKPSLVDTNFVETEPTIILTEDRLQPIKTNSKSLAIDVNLELSKETINLSENQLQNNKTSDISIQGTNPESKEPISLLKPNETSNTLEKMVNIPENQMNKIEDSSSRTIVDLKINESLNTGEDMNILEYLEVRLKSSTIHIDVLETDKTTFEHVSDDQVKLPETHSDKTDQLKINKSEKTTISETNYKVMKIDETTSEETILSENKSKEFSANHSKCDILSTVEWNDLEKQKENSKVTEDKKLDELEKFDEFLPVENNQLKINKTNENLMTKIVESVSTEVDEIGQTIENSDESSEQLIKNPPGSVSLGEETLTTTNEASVDEILKNLSTEIENIEKDKEFSISGQPKENVMEIEMPDKFTTNERIEIINNVSIESDKNEQQKSSNIKIEETVIEAKVEDESKITETNEIVNKTSIEINEMDDEPNEIVNNISMNINETNHEPIENVKSMLAEKNETDYHESSNIEIMEVKTENKFTAIKPYEVVDNNISIEIDKNDQQELSKIEESKETVIEIVKNNQQNLSRIEKVDKTLLEIDENDQQRKTKIEKTKEVHKNVYQKLPKVKAIQEIFMKMEKECTVDSSNIREVEEGVAKEENNIKINEIVDENIQQQSSNIKEVEEGVVDEEKKIKMNEIVDENIEKQSSNIRELEEDVVDEKKKIKINEIVDENIEQQSSNIREVEEDVVDEDKKIKINEIFDENIQQQSSNIREIEEEVVEDIKINEIADENIQQQLSNIREIEEEIVKEETKIKINEIFDENFQQQSSNIREIEEGIVEDKKDIKINEIVDENIQQQLFNIREIEEGVVEEEKHNLLSEISHHELSNDLDVDHVEETITTINEYDLVIGQVDEIMITDNNVISVVKDEEIIENTVEIRKSDEITEIKMDTLIDNATESIIDTVEGGTATSFAVSLDDNDKDIPQHIISDNLDVGQIEETETADESRNSSVTDTDDQIVDAFASNVDQNAEAVLKRNKINNIAQRLLEKGEIRQHENNQNESVPIIPPKKSLNKKYNKKYSSKKEFVALSTKITGMLESVRKLREVDRNENNDDLIRISENNHESSEDDISNPLKILSEVAIKHDNERDIDQNKEDAIQKTVKEAVEEIVNVSSADQIKEDAIQKTVKEAVEEIVNVSSADQNKEDAIQKTLKETVEEIVNVSSAVTKQNRLSSNIELPNNIIEESKLSSDDVLANKNKIPLVNSTARKLSSKATKSKNSKSIINESSNNQALPIEEITYNVLTSKVLLPKQGKTSGILTSSKNVNEPSNTKSTENYLLCDALSHNKVLSSRSVKGKRVKFNLTTVDVESSSNSPNKRSFSSFTSSHVIPPKSINEPINMKVTTKIMSNDKLVPKTAKNKNSSISSTVTSPRNIKTTNTVTLPIEKILPNNEFTRRLLSLKSTKNNRFITLSRNKNQSSPINDDDLTQSKITKDKPLNSNEYPNIFLLPTTKPEIASIKETTKPNQILPQTGNTDDLNNCVSKKDNVKKQYKRQILKTSKTDDKKLIKKSNQSVIYEFNEDEQMKINYPIKTYSPIKRSIGKQQPSSLDSRSKYDKLNRKCDQKQIYHDEHDDQILDCTLNKQNKTLSSDSYVQNKYEKHDDNHETSLNKQDQNSDEILSDISTHHTHDNDDQATVTLDSNQKERKKKTNHFMNIKNTDTYKKPSICINNDRNCLKPMNDLTSLSSQMLSSPAASTSVTVTTPTPIPVTPTMNTIDNVFSDVSDNDNECDKDLSHASSSSTPSTFKINPDLKDPLSLDSLDYIEAGPPKDAILSDEPLRIQTSQNTDHFGGSSVLDDGSGVVSVIDMCYIPYSDNTSILSDDDLPQQMITTISPYEEFYNSIEGQNYTFTTDDQKSSQTSSALSQQSMNVNDSLSQTIIQPLQQKPLLSLSRDRDPCLGQQAVFTQHL